jgi:NAD+ kinase
MFDPSSPYRRKSSLVTSESTPMLRRSQTNKTQCLVHQFLESQRRVRQARHSHQPAVILDEQHHQLDHHSRATGDFDATARRHKSQPARPTDIAIAVDASTELGLDRVADPKGSDESSRSRGGSQVRKAKTVANPGGVHSKLAGWLDDGRDGLSDNDGGREVEGEDADGDNDDAETEEEVGQVDEKHWTSDITATRSKDRDELPPSGTPPPQSEADELHSRLLTKKQLSEMAWGVRELSRRLGSVRLKFKAKSIFLLTKIYDQDLIPKTRELAAWLLSPERKVRYVVYVEKELKENRRFDARGLVEEVKKRYVEAGEEGEDVARRLRSWTEDMCRTRPHTFDFVITLGGDGTVLYASWLFQRIVPPVLSFSLGSLGFLTKFDFEEYQSTLNTAFDKGVTVSLRLRFEGTIMRSQRKRVENGTEMSEDEEADRQRRRDLVEELVGEEQEDEHTHRPDGTYEIINEIVVDRGPNPSESHFSRFPLKSVRND